MFNQFGFYMALKDIQVNYEELFQNLKKNYLTVDQNIWNGEKEKKNQQKKRTYHVHTQNKITVSGTSGKVEYYNNTCYIVILSHPP